MKLVCLFFITLLLGTQEQPDLSSLNANDRDLVAKALAANDYPAAESVLVQNIDHHPRDPNLLILAARIFFLDKKPLNTAIALKKAEKLRPLTPAEHFTLALAYIGCHQPQWAKTELTDLSKHDSQNVTYRYWLARLSYDERNYEAAAQILQAVTKIDPHFTRAWDNLGLSLEGAGRLEEAAPAYREAVRLNRLQNPPNPWPPLNLGIFLTRTGDLKSAEAMIREALHYDPTLAEAHYRLGVNLHRQNIPDTAIRELQQAAELDPAAASPVYELGQIYREQGRPEAADQAFAHFKNLKQNPSNSAPQ